MASGCLDCCVIYCVGVRSAAPRPGPPRTGESTERLHPSFVLRGRGSVGGILGRGSEGGAAGAGPDW